MAMQNENGTNGADDASASSGVSVWKETLRPLKHEPGCSFNEEEFQNVLEKSLFTPEKLMELVIYENERDAKNHVRAKKRGKFRPAPELRSPEKLLTDPFVSKYLKEQREMLTAKRSENYRLCRCSFEEEKRRKNKSPETPEKPEVSLDREMEVVDEEKNKNLLVKTNAEITEMDVCMANLAMAPQQLDVFPIILGKPGGSINTPASAPDSEVKVEQDAATATGKEVVAFESEKDPTVTSTTATATVSETKMEITTPSAPPADTQEIIFVGKVVANQTSHRPQSRIPPRSPIKTRRSSVIKMYSDSASSSPASSQEEGVKKRGRKKKLSPAPSNLNLSLSSSSTPTPPSPQPTLQLVDMEQKQSEDKENAADEKGKVKNCEELFGDISDSDSESPRSQSQKIDAKDGEKKDGSDNEELMEI